MKVKGKISTVNFRFKQINIPCKLNENKGCIQCKLASLELIVKNY